MSDTNFKTIEELIGKVLTKVERSTEEAVFETQCGERFHMWHSQDCCESVALEKVDGELTDIIGSPITAAREEFASEPPLPREYPPESATYTNYTLETKAGRVVFKWAGESNGYYSESVYFEKL